MNVVVVAFVIGFLGSGVLGLVAFLDIRDAERRCADARVDAQLNAGKLAITSANETTWRLNAANEKRRADALDDLIAKHAGGDAGPVAGSYERLLQEWRSASKGADAAGSAGAGAVSADPPADPPGGLRLIKPGDI